MIYRLYRICHPSSSGRPSVGASRTLVCGKRAQPLTTRASGAASVQWSTGPECGSAGTESESEWDEIKLERSLSNEPVMANAITHQGITLPISGNIHPISPITVDTIYRITFHHIQMCICISIWLRPRASASRGPLDRFSGSEIPATPRRNLSPSLRGFLVLVLALLSHVFHSQWTRLDSTPLSYWLLAGLLSPPPLPVARPFAQQVLLRRRFCPASHLMVLAAGCMLHGHVNVTN